MTTRRNFLSSIVALPGLMSLRGKLSGLIPAVAPETTSDDDVTKFVKIAIGTGGHGHTYPGATVPFGAVQLSPDTYNKGWDWSSGYHYSDDSIMGFSHTHLSGTGVGDMLDFLLMPGTGPAKIVPGTRDHPEEGYRSEFRHADEIAEPGNTPSFLGNTTTRRDLARPHAAVSPK